MKRAVYLGLLFYIVFITIPIATAIECSQSLEDRCTVNERTILGPGTYNVENIYIEGLGATSKKFNGTGNQTEFFLNELDVKEVMSVYANINGTYRDLNENEYIVYYETNPYKQAPRSVLLPLANGNLVYQVTAYTSKSQNTVIMAGILYDGTASGNKGIHNETRCVVKDLLP